MKRIKTAELVPGYVLAEDVYSFNGQLILTKGLVLTDKIITRLEFYSITSVRVEDEMTAVPDDNLPEVDLSSIKEELHSEVVRNSEEYAAFKQSFDESISGFKSSINNIVELNAPINTDSLLDSTKDLIERGKNSSFSTMDMLHNMRQYDDLTFAHSMNVALICNVFAGWLKMSKEETDMATLCGLLHDLGKLKIPDTIIKKPEKLSDDEYQIVKTHPIEGYQLLRAQNVDPHIANSALMHHEKCDGSGYPLKLTGDKIDRFAKMVAIADVYDAMTSARIYRGPMCPFRVIELFENEGLQKYDAHFILTFLENVCNTYLHYNVQLSDGRVGKVIFINKNMLSRPLIQCDNEIIDLADKKDLHIEKIL